VGLRPGLTQTWVAVIWAALPDTVLGSRSGVGTLAGWRLLIDGPSVKGQRWSVSGWPGTAVRGDGVSAAARAAAARSWSRTRIGGLLLPKCPCWGTVEGDSLSDREEGTTR